MVKAGDCVIRDEGDYIRVVKSEGDERQEGLKFDKEHFWCAVKKMRTG
jgi:hypothetical protein